jgi:hypothetical protein
VTNGLLFWFLSHSSYFCLPSVQSYFKTLFHIHYMGLQPSYGGGPHRLLNVGSLAARGQIACSVLILVYKWFTNMAVGRVIQAGWPRVDGLWSTIFWSTFFRAGRYQFPVGYAWVFSVVYISKYVVGTLKTVCNKCVLCKWNVWAGCYRAPLHACLQSYHNCTKGK